MNGDPVYYTSIATATTAASPSINMGGGIMATDNTGHLTWNGDPLATYKSNKKGITTINEMLKDEMMREIILCKTREDCKEQYGSYGLKMFDSMMNEILQTAIKSEELFTDMLQKEKNKAEALRNYVLDKIIDAVEKRKIALELLNITRGF